MKNVTSIVLGLAVVFLTIALMNQTQAEEPALGVGQEVAYFSGGCFWCSEADMEKCPGVIEAISGYSGGDVLDPNYQSVSAGKTDHRESIKVIYDVRLISYRELVDYFLAHINPTDAGGQFVDRGNQYSSAIYYSNVDQERAVRASIASIEQAHIFPSKLLTTIAAFKTFYPAEDYHQNYYKTNPTAYQNYRNGSGRNQHIEKHAAAFSILRPVKTYAKPNDSELQKRLDPLQYKVTQNSGTERSFNNIYWDNKEAGIYVDIVSGEPLFSSTDKFESGTGWPSFVRALTPSLIQEVDDRSIGMLRSEVRSRFANSHLGHLFDDGPQPTRLRYCINSAALRFIPSAKLQTEGYGEYSYLFDEKQ